MRSNVVPAVLYAGVILVLSSIPGKSFPDLKWLSYDKLLHIGEFMILGFLVSHALVQSIRSRANLFLLTLLIAGTFGAVDELYQQLIPGRLPSYADWVADVAGVVIGSLIFILVRFNRAQATTR